MSSTWLAQRAWACAPISCCQAARHVPREFRACAADLLCTELCTRPSLLPRTLLTSTHSRIEKSASDAFTNNSVLRRLISCALQVCLSRLQADKVQSCRWQSHAGRELPQQERRAATQEPAKRERGRHGPRAGIPKRLRPNCLSTAGPTASSTPLLLNAQKPWGGHP